MLSFVQKIHANYQVIAATPREVYQLKKEVAELYQKIGFLSLNLVHVDRDTAGGLDAGGKAAVKHFTAMAKTITDKKLNDYAQDIYVKNFSNELVKGSLNCAHWVLTELKPRLEKHYTPTERKGEKAFKEIETQYRLVHDMVSKMGFTSPKA